MRGCSWAARSGLPPPRVALTAFVAFFGAGLNACGGSPAPPPAAPVMEGPEDAIMRIAKRWEARYVDKGLRSPPSPVASFERHLVSRIELVRGEPSASETLSFSERFALRDGTTVNCGGTIELSIGVAYGRRAGEPALELSWPALARERPCEPANAAIPPLERQAGRARFALRSDQLVAVEPPLERRTFLPVD